MRLETMELLKILVTDSGQPGFLNNEAVYTVLLPPPYIPRNSFIVTATKAGTILPQCKRTLILEG